MDIQVITGDIAIVKTDAIILNSFKGAKSLSGDIATIDKALDGAIYQLVKQGVIKGDLNEITLVHTLGKLPASRVAIVGLGKKQELTVDKVRGAVAETCRYLRKNGVSNIATILQGAGVNKISREGAAQAIAEGARLGLYTFRRYITKKDKETGDIWCFHL